MEKAGATKAGPKRTPESMRLVGTEARVVEADPLENGERVHLNFGHTFAHAIERASDHAVPHGEAVALGMVAAASMASTTIKRIITNSDGLIKKLASSQREICFVAIVAPGPPLNAQRRVGQSL